MLNHYEPNVKATISLLRLLKVKVNNSTVNDTLQNHPDWPSLLCISDSLNKWNVPNAGGKIDPANIDEIPIPFIAYTYDNKTPLSMENPLAVVTQMQDNSITFYSKNYNKQLTKSKNDFIKTWTGIYLIAETTPQSGEKNYDINKRKSLITSLVQLGLIGLLVTLSFIFLYKLIKGNVNHSTFTTTAVYLQYLILSGGVIISSLLLWYEIDRNNPVLRKVCTGIVKGNCDAILTGKQSKLFNWLSWSEVGFFYFTGGLVVLLFTENFINSIGLIGWINILALPYTVFSVYYQWKVAKQWCVLCLAVQGLLTLGSINVIVNNILFPLPKFSFFLLSQVSLLYFLPVFLWYFMKPYLLRLQEAKSTKREYQRIKFNTEIFETLLKKQKVITVPSDGLGIDLGKPSATNTIIKVCSPFCGPCSESHPKIEKLLEDNANLKVKILFPTPNKNDHLVLKTVRHLLAINENSNQAITKKALYDWYLSNAKDYDVFAVKYPMNGELLTQDDKIDAMQKWCEEVGIQFTPTIFINGYQLPDMYNIEDLQYFLLE